MNEHLLKALNDTLSDLRIKRDEVDHDLQAQVWLVANAQQCLRDAEKPEALARTELKNIQDQLNALVGHVGGLTQHSKPLHDRIAKLSDDRVKAEKEYQATAVKLTEARENSRAAEKRMQLEEQKLKDIDVEIEEVQRQLSAIR